MSQESNLLSFLKEINNHQTLSVSDGVVIYYTGVEEELGALRTGVGCRDVSNHFGLSISGKDTFDFLHRISTNQLRDMQPNESRWTVFTNEKGRILDSVLLLPLEDRTYLYGHNGSSKLLQFWLKKYIIADDVFVHDASATVSAIELFGPQVTSLLILAFGDRGKELQAGHLNKLGYQYDAIYCLPLDGSKFEEKTLLFGNTPIIQKLLQVFLKYGEDGMVDFKLIGEQAFNELRIERGVPGAAELNDAFHPHEALLLDQVSFTKGCYIGQEIIARLETYNKVQKYLRSLIFREAVEANVKPVLIDERRQEAGVVTSLAWSHTLKCTIGLGYVRKEYADEGTALSVQNGAGHGQVIVRLPGNV